MEYDRDIRQKGEYKYDNYLGNEVYGKTIGIVGYGQIGEKVARIAKAFDMNILCYTRTPKNIDGVNFVDFEKLLGDSDYIIVCCPLNKESENMFNRSTFNKIKKGSILINVSRDEIVNTKDLCESLKNKTLSGFGMDGTVYTTIDKKILEFNNVITTAHNGFNTVEANERIEKYAINNIEAFLSGKPMNVINN